MKDKRMELRVAEEEKLKIIECAKLLKISASRFLVMSALQMAELIENESKND